MENKTYEITESGELLYKDKKADLIFEKPTHLIELENGICVLCTPIICKSEKELTNKMKKVSFTGGGIVGSTFYVKDMKTYPISCTIELKHKDRKLLR